MRAPIGQGWRIMRESNSLDYLSNHGSPVDFSRGCEGLDGGRWIWCLCRSILRYVPASEEVASRSLVPDLPRVTFGALMSFASFLSLGSIRNDTTTGLTTAKILRDTRNALVCMSKEVVSAIVPMLWTRKRGFEVVVTTWGYIVFNE